MENDSTTSKTSNECSTSSRSTKKRKNPSATLASPPTTKRQASIDKFLTSNVPTPPTSSPPTSAVASTGSVKAFKPFWNARCKELSKKLWLPIVTASAVLHTHSSNTFSSVAERKSWFLTKVQYPTNLPTVVPNMEDLTNWQRICSPLQRSLPPASMAVDPPKSESVLRVKHIRLYPTSEQKATLREWFGAARWVYNNCVEAVKSGRAVAQLTALRDLFVNSDAADLKDRQYFLKVPYEVRSDAVRDYTKALKTSLALKRGGHIDKFEIGFRSKSAKAQTIYMRGKSFCERSNFFYQSMIEGRMKSAEPIPEINNDCKLMRERNGDYYLIVPVEKPVTNVDKPFKIAALDPGIRSFQTVYNPQGSCKEYAKGDYKRVERLAFHYDQLQSKWSQKDCKAKKRYKLKRAGRRLIKRIQNLVKDAHNNIAKELCTLYETILLPEFNTSFMVRKRKRNISGKTARAMLTWSHYKFKQRLIAKSQETGTHVEIVTEEFTSKTCGCCGWQNDALGSSKVFECKQCRVTTGRDVNAARCILLKRICTTTASSGLGLTPLSL